MQGFVLVPIQTAMYILEQGLIEIKIFFYTPDGHWTECLYSTIENDRKSGYSPYGKNAGSVVKGVGPILY